MRNDFHSSWASNTEISSLELCRDLILASDAETLSNQSPNWVTAAKGPHSIEWLRKRNRYSSCQVWLQELWSTTIG